MRGFVGFLLGVSVSLNAIQLCYILKHKKQIDKLEGRCDE
jgi:hypothetical protein